MRNTMILNKHDDDFSQPLTDVSLKLAENIFDYERDIFVQKITGKDRFDLRKQEEGIVISLNLESRKRHGVDGNQLLWLSVLGTAIDDCFPNFSDALRRKQKDKLLPNVDLSLKEVKFIEYSLRYLKISNRDLRQICAFAGLSIEYVFRKFKDRKDSFYKSVNIRLISEGNEKDVKLETDVIDAMWRNHHIKVNKVTKRIKPCEHKQTQS